MYYLQGYKVYGIKNIQITVIIKYYYKALNTAVFGLPYYRW